MTLDIWRRAAAEELRGAGCDDFQADADWIACGTLGLSRGQLKMAGNRALSEAALSRMNAQLSRRRVREPLQYILGHAPFLELDILCDSRALIPRPETEYMAEIALSEAPKGAFDALDLCCGTGALGLALKNARPAARVTLADISPEALTLAAENATRLGLDVRFAQGDLFSALPGERFDFILCNPPYVSSGELPSLQAEVRAEPHLALDGGPDGLSLYKRIAESLSAHLNPNGRVYFEVGAGQAWAVAEMMGAVGRVQILKDLSGVERFVTVHSTIACCFGTEKNG